MSDSRPLRIDWQLILAKLGALGVEPDAPCLICVPVAGVHLLAALAGRLEWQATYRIANYDFSDWEDLQTIVEDTLGGLNPVCEDLINQITTNINTTIVNQANQDALCCYLETGAPIVDPEPSEAPLPDPFGAEWGELCKRAQAAHDQGAIFLQNAFDLFEAVGGLSIGAIGALLGAIFIVTIPVSIVLLVIGFFAALVLDAYTDDAVVVWNSLKHDIVCCFVTSQSPSDAKTCIDDVIDTAVTEGSLPSAVAGLFKAIYNMGTVNSVWVGEEGYDVGGYSEEYCEDCLGEPDEIGGFSWEIQSWNDMTTNANCKHGAFPLNGTYNVVGHTVPGAIGKIFTNVRSDLTAYSFGDDEFSDFNGNWSAPVVELGVSATPGNSGALEATFNNFKILVNYSNAPGFWHWIDANVTPVDAEVPGTFEVTEGVGGSVLYDVLLNFNDNYVKTISMAIPT